MKNYVLLCLMLLTTIVSAKPTIGFININYQSPSLEGEASDISDFLSMRLDLFLGEDYKIVRSPIDLEELTMAADCAKQDVKCMFLVAKLMKVDYLIYGTTISKNKDSYSLKLVKIDVKNKKANNRELLRKIGEKSYNKVIDNFISDMFPKTKLVIDSLNTPEVLNVTVQSGVVADFYLDEKLIGKTPISLKSDKVAAGKHTITLKAKGYDTFKREINITPSSQIMALTLIKVFNPAEKKNNKFTKKDNNKNNLDLSTKTVWYKDWRVQAGVGVAVVVVVAVVAVVLLTGDDQPANNVVITW